MWIFLESIGYYNEWLLGVGGGAGVDNETVFIPLEFWLPKGEKKYCQIPFLTGTLNVECFLQLCFDNGLLSNVLL